MRRTVLLSFSVLVAACADQPTGPTSGDVPDGPDLARMEAPGPGAVAPITVFTSEPQSLGYTEGDVFRYPNLPDPDVGGDRVVWQWRASPYYGDATIHQVDLATGARAELATGALSMPRTSGRYTHWQDGEHAIVVLDHATGARTRIEGQFPFAGSAEVAGDRMAFVDITAGTLELYDLRSGERRVITTSGYEKPYGSIRSIGFDGRYVAWSADRRGTQYGTGIAIHDTQTGEERVAVPFTYGGMTGIAIDGGRIVFSAYLDGGRRPVFLHDVATGQTRQLSSDAQPAQVFPRISGDFVVWDDTRQDQHPAYVYNHDVYLYDLRAGVEIPLIAGPEWAGTPRIDGRRLVYTERRNDRWEVMAVQLMPASIEGLREEVRRMTASGAVRNAGMAHNLDVYLTQAAAARDAGKRARAEQWLRKFIDQVRRQGRRQIETSAARRLEGMAAGVIARL